MAYPKILYPAVLPTTTLSFTYPPTKKGGAYGVFDQESVGFVTYTLSGQRQTMFIRQDQFLRLTMEQLPWEDMPNWQLFFQYAMQGNSFLYYPDADGTAYDEFWLEDAGGSGHNDSPITAWNPAMASGTKMFSSFELYLRKVPGGLTHA